MENLGLSNYSVNGNHFFTMNKVNSTKIFISYSHDSDNHKKFVRKLADKLQADNLDCIIDQDLHSPEQGWVKWMLDMIEEADFVLVIFTPSYAESWRGKSSRKGATFERSIITHSIYENFGKNKKFIPIIPASGNLNDVQFPLKGFTIYTLMKDYDRLYSALKYQSPSIDQFIKEKEGTENSNKNDDCPYRGLRSFEEEHAEYFFGRKAFIDDQLMPAIENNSLPFISLFGATGVGKSSVVFAGLVPELKRINWKCVNFEPGNDPFHSFAKTLISLNNQERGDYNDKEVIKLAKNLKEEQCLPSHLKAISENLTKANLLIIIDKFEEIYRKNPCESNDNSSLDQANLGLRFLRCLLGGIKWLKASSLPNQIVFLVITTSEGHDKTTSFSDYAALFDHSAHIQLTGLKPEEMRQVIEMPAKRKGVEFDTNLVETILNDAGQEPGVLPLLEVALRQLWLEKKDKLITVDAYKKIGGIKKALANYADRCMKSRSDTDQKIAGEIFIRIIDAREDLINTGNIAPRAIREEDLIAEAKTKMKPLVDFLVEKRLLMRESQNSKQVLKIPHDLLIKYWPQINDWLNQDAKNRYFINDLKKRAEIWQKNGQKPSDLDSGPTLEITEKFLNENSNDFRLTNLMKQFHEKGKIYSRENEKKKKKDKVFKLSAIPVSIILVLAFVNYKQNEELKHLKTQEQLISAVKGKYLSSGEKTHFVPPNEDKRIGNSEFRKGNYSEAESYFKDLLEKSPDDPEARIYFNNAKAFFSRNYLTIVASVPIKYSNDIAKEMLRGIALAQNEINSKGGINGKLLHIVIADDNNDPDDVRVIANYLINQEDIIAVIGSNVSEATQAAANIYQGKMIMISPTSFAVDLSKIKSPGSEKNYIFFAVNDYKIVMQGLVKYIKDNIADYSKLFVCDDSEAFDQNVIRGLFENNELPLVKVISEAKQEELCDLSNNEKNYNKAVEKAIGMGINSLFIAPHVSRIDIGINLAKYALDRNSKLKILGSSTLYNATTLKNGEVSNGLVIPAYWHPKVSQKNSFYQNAKNLWGEQSINGITWRTAASYDAVYVISTALERIDTNDGFSRKNLQQKLAQKDFKYEGALGEIRFKQDGRREDNNSFLIEVKPCNKDCPAGYKYDFYLKDKSYDLR